MNRNYPQCMNKMQCPVPIVQWLQNDYLDEWDACVQKRQKHTAAQKASLKKGAKKIYTAAS